MGNTASEPYEGPPELLSERSLEGIAEWMGSDVCEENVFVMVRIVNLSYPSRPSGPTLSSHLPPFPPSEGSRQLTRSFAILSALATLVHLFPSVPIPTVRGRSAIHSSYGCLPLLTSLTSGISTSAGIPDFRSPKTGKYSHGPVGSHCAWNRSMRRSSLTSLRCPWRLLQVSTYVTVPRLGRRCMRLTLFCHWLPPLHLARRLRRLHIRPILPV